MFSYAIEMPYRATDTVFAKNVSGRFGVRKTADTHHFQVLQRRQHGLQVADDLHELLTHQRLGAVQQVHHLILESFHIGRRRRRRRGNSDDGTGGVRVLTAARRIQ